MANYYSDNDDIKFLVEHGIDWATVVPLFENHFTDAKKYSQSKDTRYEYAPSSVAEAVENYRGIFEGYGQVIEGELTPYTLELDREGQKFVAGKVIPPAAQVKFFDTLKQSGLLNYSVARDYGGNNLPISARNPITEMVSRADCGTQIILSYFNMPEMIEFYGDEDMKKKYLPLFIEGKMLGAMALTEPNIGSDLTNAATKAVRQPDGSFRLTGTKIFITQGCGFADAPAAIFTIARSLDKKGAFGLSFFLVETKDIEVSRIEEKIGLHSSATCEIRYDNSYGQLIGEEGAGLVKYAINMMNGARIGIACQSVGIAQAATSLAAEYAKTRIQFGVPIEQLPAVRRMLEENEARTQAARALVYEAGKFADCHYGLQKTLLLSGMDEKEARKQPDAIKWDKLAKIFTPLSKFTASEFACKVAYDALQIHGGVGYTEEYEIAKVYRDVRITTIYEGTTQLQTIALIGSIIEGAKDGSYLQQWLANELANLHDAGVKAQLQSWWDLLVKLAAKYKGMEKGSKEDLALELAWHLAYLICSALLARHEQLAAELNHPHYASKKKARDTFMRLSAAKIAAGETYFR